MRSGRLLGALASLVMVPLAGCGTGDEPLDTTAEGDVVLRYLGTPGTVVMAELADALGYLDGIELESIGSAQGGPDQLRSLANGDAQFAVAPFNGATARVVATGLDVKAVVGSYGSSGEQEMSILTESGSDIDSGRDLIGRTIGVNTLGANAEAVIDTYLEQEGLNADEIEDVALVPLPGSALEGSLRNGQVDAALVSSVSREHALSVGGVDELVGDIEIVGEYTGGAVVVTDAFLDDRPDLARRFIGGVARAVEFQRTHTREEVLDLYEPWLAERGRAGEAEALALWQGSGIPHTGGLLSEQDFAMWLDWLEAKGEIEPGSLDVEEAFTNDFNPYQDRAEASGS